MSTDSSLETEIDISKKEILISSSEINQRVAQLGKEISVDYQGRELHLVGVLNGAFIFLADLVRQINIPCQICFLQASSYKDQKVSSGEVTLMHNLDLRGKDVLVVEDIFDTGLTLKYVMEDLLQQKPFPFLSYTIPFQTSPFLYSPTYFPSLLYFFTFHIFPTLYSPSYL